LAAGVPIYCLICAQHLAEAHGATVASPAVECLGNPDSTPELHCLDCHRRYDDSPLDVALPDADWLAIHPEGPDGVLCAQCIVARAAKLQGVTAVVAHFHRVVRNEERDSRHERQKPDSMNDAAHPRIVALTGRKMQIPQVTITDHATHLAQTALLPIRLVNISGDRVTFANAPQVTTNGPPRLQRVCEPS
jgi:hypothetical protein